VIIANWKSSDSSDGSKDDISNSITNGADAVIGIKGEEEGQPVGPPLSSFFKNRKTRHVKKSKKEDAQVKAHPKNAVGKVTLAL